MDGRQCWAVDAGGGEAASADTGTPGGPAKDGLDWLDLRRLWSETDHTDLDGGRSRRAAGGMGPHAPVLRSLRCLDERGSGPSCQAVSTLRLEAFPRLAPAVICLVEHGDGTVLLAHGPQFAPGTYSCLAGFVEPGETLEEAVAHEVGEEVGVELTEIRYFASQPWPFPHSLMIGFTARWRSGEITVDGTEITEAAWFDPQELPGLPSSISIARQLIEDWRSRR